MYAPGGAYANGPRRNLAKPPETVHLSPMSVIAERLKAALADRYAIEREAEPASTSEKHQHERGAP